MSLGENIEIYLMDGTTSGRWQAKLLNWNCEVYRIPRKMFKDCNKIDDLHTPAVYFLFGLDNESEKRFVYVGEGEDALKRIMQPHGFESDGSYWTEAVIFVTPDGTLDKANIKYLENRFHKIVVSLKMIGAANVDVSTYHQWIFDIYREYQFGSVPKDENEFVWDKVLKAISKIGKKYSYIVVDEAQDFPIPLMKLINMVSVTHTYFIDPNQSIEEGKTSSYDVIY